MAYPEQQNPLDQFLEELRSNQDLQLDSFSADLHQGLGTASCRQSIPELPSAPWEPLCQMMSQRQPAPGILSLELEEVCPPGDLAHSPHCE